MFKRIVIGIFAFVMMAFTLCGCSFVTFDSERDMQQKIAYIESYKITNSVKTDDETLRTAEYTTTEKTIYKRDLAEYVNNNASSLSSSFGSDYEGLYRYAADMLINMELIINEANALIECGNIEWGVKQNNAVKKNIYSVIDNTITSLKNTILTERDQETITTGDNTDISTDTTYPVKPEPTDNVEKGDGEIVWDEEPWEPSVSSYPAISGDSDMRSLEREALRRFVALIKERVEDDFRITKEEREKFDAEIKAIDKRIDEKGIESIYPVIGSYTYPMSAHESEFGYLMYYITGKSLERSQKLTLLQEYLSDGVSVNTDEVLKSFTQAQNEQMALYTQDISAYDSAMSEGSTVLYHANDNYFYVKHILLPFSDAQTDAFKAYQTRADIMALEESEQKEKINAYRARLAEEIVCYPHVNGEDDLTRPMSVAEVMNHIRAEMLGKQGNVQSADAAFDDLIYLYNTDPGAFGNSKGYVVKYRLNDGESETYMQEFADAARYMRENLAPGQVYYEPVVTDYGVHIMYLASIVKPGKVSVYDYTTPAKTEQYYDLLEQPIRSQRESAAYTKWENNILSYNYKEYSELYEDNFKNLWGA